MYYRKIILPLLVVISIFILLLLTSEKNVFSLTSSTLCEEVVEKPRVEPDDNPLNDNKDSSRSRNTYNTYKQPQNSNVSNTYDIEPGKASIEGSPVIASIIHNAKVYSAIRDEVLMEIAKGQQVELLQDRNCSWYEVSFKNITGEDIKGWVKSEDLSIPPDPPTNPSKCSKEQLEDFINEQDFKSETSHLVWTDIDRQLVYVFEGSQNYWQLHKTMICSTGKNVSPTTRGLFTVSDRDTWMYTPRLGSGAKNWVRFNDAYLFHSVAYAKDEKTVIDDTLGKRSSAGCIRLSLEDSQWIYDNIEKDTTVWVN